MAIFIAVIQMVFFSLAMTQQPLGNNLDRWWFLVTPMQSSPLPFSSPWSFGSQPLPRRDDYTYTPGIGSHKVHTRAATWNEARKTCEQEGGHLAVINSIAEANAITELYKKAGAFVGGTGSSDWAFIGFHDLFQEGEYVTLHIQSLARAGFTQWATGQPDNGGGKENCGSVHRNGGLNDLQCGGKYGFICELPVY